MRSLIVAVVVVTSASCIYEFNRTVDVKPGDISGVAVRADLGNDPAPFAQVAVQGGSLVRRTRENGAFLIRGLAEGAWVLRFSDDDDGDNENERTSFSASRIVRT